VANSTNKRTTPAIMPRATAPMRTIQTATAFYPSDRGGAIVVWACGVTGRCNEVRDCAEICPVLSTGVQL
jgi:hypothetical protein